MKETNDKRMFGLDMAVIYTQEESLTVPLLPYIGMFCIDIFGGVFVLVRLLTEVHASFVFLLIAAAQEIVPSGRIIESGTLLVSGYGSNIG